MKVKCPDCQHIINLPEDYNRKYVQCDFCGNASVVNPVYKNGRERNSSS